MRGSTHNYIVAHDNGQRSEDILHGGRDLTVVVIEQPRFSPVREDNQAEESSRFNQTEVLKYSVSCRSRVQPIGETYPRNRHEEDQSRNEHSGAVQRPSVCPIGAPHKDRGRGQVEHDVEAVERAPDGQAGEICPRR
jgi:hypothetical protein